MNGESMLVDSHRIDFYEQVTTSLRLCTNVKNLNGGATG